MPNWCENNCTIYGSTDKMNELENVLIGYIDHDRDFFGYYVPVEGDKNVIDVIGQSNVWGTKWEPDIWDWSRDDNVITISMNTAWGPPIQFYEQMEEKYDFEIEASYYEPGMCFVGYYGGDHFDYAAMDSEEVRSEIPKDLDEMYGISDYLEEYEEEERLEKEAEEAKKSDFDYDTYNGGVEYFGKK